GPESKRGKSERLERTGPSPKRLFRRPRPRPGLPRARPTHPRERALRPPPDGRDRGDTPPGRRPRSGDSPGRKPPLRDDDRRGGDPDRGARRFPNPADSALWRPPLRGPHLPSAQQRLGSILYRRRDGPPLRRPDEPPLQGHLRPARPGGLAHSLLSSPPHGQAAKQRLPDGPLSRPV
ncbi:MAG: hypothetical protein AVDCRST_MAG55-1201, partial [uncultured Rubrobacteraceae bacterium]